MDNFDFADEDELNLRFDDEDPDRFERDLDEFELD